MRVAQIAPLFESVPPQKYGGTERVVSYLTEELVQQGHEVTLFASGDSQTKAELIAGCDYSLRLNSNYGSSTILHTLMLEKLRNRIYDFDIIHFHTDFFHFPILRNFSVPTLTTLHGRLDIPYISELYQEYKEYPLVSISDSQRAPIPGAHWCSTIHHGLPKQLYQFHGKKGSYAAFLGRISPEKRPDRAIEIANRAGIPLKIAAKIDPVDKGYYEEKIKPLIESSADVEFVGEISDEEKNSFLGNASVLLFPIDWPEPFGLVMIEAMARGTPVIAFRNGSAPEVIDDGLTGFLVNSIDEAVEKIALIPELSRKKCFEVFEKRFSIEAVVKKYVSLYQKVIKEKQNNYEFNYLKMMKRRALEWKTSSSLMTKLI